jgi:hypothetical protein
MDVSTAIALLMIPVCPSVPGTRCPLTKWTSLNKIQKMGRYQSLTLATIKKTNSLSTTVSTTDTWGRTDTFNYNSAKKLQFCI